MKIQQPSKSSGNKIETAISKIRATIKNPSRYQQYQSKIEIATNNPMDFVRETRGGRSVESVGGGAVGGWRRWLVALVDEWLRSVGGAAVGLRRLVGGATRFWERRFRLRRREN